MKKKILIIIGGIILIILISGFGYWRIIIQKTTGEILRIDELCNQFTPVTGEITCKEAAKIALKKYSGEVYDIYKTEFYGSVENWEKRDVWLVKIKLKETITDPVKFPKTPEVGTVEIAVDRYNKESLLITYGPALE